jgi:hypothetical protein
VSAGADRRGGEVGRPPHRRFSPSLTSSHSVPPRDL